MHINFLSKSTKGTYKTSSIVVDNDEGEVLEFKVESTFNGSLIKDDAFFYLNIYLNTLSPEQLKGLFDLYKQAYELLSTPISVEELDEQLSQVLCTIVDGIDLNDVYNWFDANRVALDLRIPENCMDTYELKEGDNRGTREQTYLTEDYKWLITLSIALRVLLPVWLEYVDMIKLYSSGDFKELRAFKLIYKSRIFTSPPFEKLKTYIKYNLKPENYTLVHHVLKGINSGIFFEWLLSLMVLRRLCIKDLRALEQGKNMITFVHQFINQKIDVNVQQAKQIKPLKKFKDSENGGSPSDNAKDKASRLEIYKQKQDVSQGEIVEIEHSISDFMRCAERLCFTIDKDLVMECIETARKLKKYSLSEPQITLLKWVFKPIVSPRGIPYISKDKIIDALGVTQAVLWSRGHKYLALLSTCYTDISPEVMTINSIDSKSKIDKELIEQINTLYPFSKSKKKETVSNMVLKSISQLSDKFSSTPWLYTASDKFVQEVCPEATKGILPIKLELKILLTKLIIEIGSRKF